MSVAASPRIRATKAGVSLIDRLTAAPRPLGRVHSVFERAVNVLAHDGRLLTLHGPGALAAPFALALDTAPGRRWPSVGSAVTCADGVLFAEGMTLDWREAAAVDTLVHPDDAIAPASFMSLRQVLVDEPLPAPAPALHAPPAVTAQHLVVSGLALGDGHRFLAGAERLVGLGEGLTPAGDDWLVGVLAVAFRFRADALQGDGRIAQGIVTAARRGTTRIAGEFLAHAALGHFSEPIVDFAHATTAPVARRALGALLACGATSGADTAAGMRMTLAALTPRSRPGAATEPGRRSDLDPHAAARRCEPAGASRAR